MLAERAERLRSLVRRGCRFAAGRVWRIWRLWKAYQPARALPLLLQPQPQLAACAAAPELAPPLPARRCPARHNAVTQAWSLEAVVLAPLPATRAKVTAQGVPFVQILHPQLPLVPPTQIQPTPQPRSQPPQQLRPPAGAARRSSRPSALAQARALEAALQLGPQPVPCVSLPQPTEPQPLPQTQPPVSDDEPEPELVVDSSSSDSSDSEEAVPEWKSALRQGRALRATRARPVAPEPPPSPSSKHSAPARGPSRVPRAQLYPHAAAELFVPPPHSAAELRGNAEPEPAQCSGSSRSAGISSVPSAEPLPPEARAWAPRRRSGLPNGSARRRSRRRVI